MTIPSVPGPETPDTHITDVEPIPGKDEPLPGSEPVPGRDEPTPEQAPPEGAVAD